MEKIRVLHFVNSLNYGGVESFLNNLIKNLDNNIISDIMVRDNNNPMEEIFEGLGVNIIKSPKFPNSYLKHRAFLKDFVKKNGEKYNAIHLHANSLIYTLPIGYFKKYSPETQIILHSHSTKSNNKIAELVHKINIRRYNKDITKRIAVSKKAGEWMFSDYKYHIIYNGIDINEHQFNKKNRDLIRKEFGISDNEVVIGSVGRLSRVKNFSFLIHLIDELKKNENIKYRLLIVGKGELETELKEMADSLDLKDDVLFCGHRDDVSSILSAMDIYLQPSLFEGFPFSVVEAEIANLPTVVSDIITNEVSISNKLYFLSINDFDKWINLIRDLSIEKVDRKNYRGIDTNKVDVEIMAKEFEHIYNIKEVKN